MPIHYPLIELTDWVFRSEKIFEPITEADKDAIHYIRPSRVGKHLQRELIDSKGQRIMVCDPVVIKRKKSSFPTLWEHQSEVRFNFEPTGAAMELSELKDRVLSNSRQIYHITHSKLMSHSEFVTRIHNAVDHATVIRTATFLEQL